MSDKPREKKRGGGWAVVLIVGLALALLYVASVGPTARLAASAGGRSEKIWASAYAPLLYLRSVSFDISDALDWYLRCCGVTVVETSPDGGQTWFWGVRALKTQPTQPQS